MVFLNAFVFSMFSSKPFLSGRVNAVCPFRWSGAARADSLIGETRASRESGVPKPDPESREIMAGTKESVCIFNGHGVMARMRMKPHLALAQKRTGLNRS